MFCSVRRSWQLHYANDDAEESNDARKDAKGEPEALRVPIDRNSNR
jgi:hypothetical protein